MPNRLACWNGNAKFGNPTRSTLDIVNDFHDFNYRFLITIEMKFQLRMLARLDDACNLKKVNLKRLKRYVQFLLCQMCWSKNTLEERNAPDQLLLGAADRHNRRKVFGTKAVKW